MSTAQEEHINETFCRASSLMFYSFFRNIKVGLQDSGILSSLRLQDSGISCSLRFTSRFRNIKLFKVYFKIPEH